MNLRSFEKHVSQYNPRFRKVVTVNKNCVLYEKQTKHIYVAFADNKRIEKYIKDGFALHKMSFNIPFLEAGILERTWLIKRLQRLFGYDEGIKLMQELDRIVLNWENI